MTICSNIEIHFYCIKGALERVALRLVFFNEVNEFQILPVCPNQSLLSVALL